MSLKGFYTADHFTIAKDEIFGPVQSILKWDTMGEVRLLQSSRELCAMPVLLRLTPQSSVGWCRSLKEPITLNTG